MPPRTSFWLAIAGPLANIIAGTVLFVASYWLVPTGQGEAGLRVVAGLHFLMAAVNMVPLPPLDGWRAWNAWAVMSKHERWSLPDTTGKIQNLVLGGVTGLTVYLVLLTLSGY